MNECQQLADKRKDKRATYRVQAFGHLLLASAQVRVFCISVCLSTHFILPFSVSA